MPPRSFVRWQRSGFHRSRIVQLVRRAGAAGSSCIGYDACRAATPDGDDWFGLTESELPILAAYEWAVRPDCGAVVLFSGTVRDHAEGRDGVEHLTYEAYEEQVVARFAEIGAELRRRWPDDRARRPAAPHRPARGRRELRHRGRVGAAPGRGVRGRPLRHRRAEGVRADLEARGLGRRRRLGNRRHTTCRDPRDVGRPDDRHRRDRRRSPSPIVAWWSSIVAAVRVDHRMTSPRSVGTSTRSRPRRAARRSIG